MGAMGVGQKDRLVRVASGANQTKGGGGLDEAAKGAPHRRLVLRDQDCDYGLLLSRQVLDRHRFPRRRISPPDRRAGE